MKLMILLFVLFLNQRLFIREVNQNRLKVQYIIYLKQMQLTNNKIEMISKGNNSQIYLYGQSQKVVLKVVASLGGKEVKHLLNEQAILGKLQHQGIIRAIKYKENISLNKTGQPTQQTVNRNVLVLEHAKHGSLLDFIKKNKMDLPNIRYHFRELCQAIQYLHCNYIVHRDLKLDNILVSQINSNVQLKLSDFGFACSYYEDQKIKLFNSFKGTRRGYMAPQIHETLNNPKKYYDASKSDIFALGVILFALIFGKLPFEFATKQNKIFKQIEQKQFDLFWQNHIVELNRLQNKDHSMVQDLKLLIQSMVCHNPQQRFNIKEVLQHSWMKGHQNPFRFN